MQKTRFLFFATELQRNSSDSSFQHVADQYKKRRKMLFICVYLCPSVAKTSSIPQFLVHLIWQWLTCCGDVEQIGQMLHTPFLSGAEVAGTMRAHDDVV